MEEEEEEEKEEEEEVEEEVKRVGKKRKGKGKVPAPKNKKSRKVTKLAHLTKEQVLEMSEWIGDNPLLYSRSLSQYYKSTSQRDRLWFEKANEMKLVDEDSPFLTSKTNPLYKWFLNIRTRLRRQQPLQRKIPPQQVWIHRCC